MKPGRRAVTVALTALALALICVPLSGCAQRPGIEWKQLFGGVETAISVHQTPDGGYIIGGSQWLLKTDSAGIEEWRKYFNSEHAYSIGPTADGGCIVCGSMISAELEGTGAWLMKLDTHGNKEWERNLGRGYASSVQQTSEEGYIVGVYDYCLVDDPGAIERCDIRLVKLDSAGNTQWEKTFPNPDKWSRLGLLDLSVRQTSDGGYIIQPTRGTIDSRLTKTDATGNEEWTETYDNMRTSSPVEPTPDGGYVFLAREVLPETGEFIKRNWLIKTDSVGEIERLKLLNYEYGWSVQPTTDGGYVILAFKEDDGSLLIRTDPRVMEQWARHFGNGDAESIQSVQQTSDGGYIIAAAKCPDASGNCQTWLIKLAGTPSD